MLDFLESYFWGRVVLLMETSPAKRMETAEQTEANRFTELKA